MLMLPTGIRIHLATSPVNFQKSIDGLSAIVRSTLLQDPLTGHLFVFHNRHKTALKILFWQDGGFCLFYKRLARGRFALPTLTGTSATLTQVQLAAILEGLDLQNGQKLSRWNPSNRLDNHAQVS